MRASPRDVPTLRSSRPATIRILPKYKPNTCRQRQITIYIKLPTAVATELTELQTTHPFAFQIPISDHAADQSLWVHPLGFSPAILLSSATCQLAFKLALLEP